MNTNFTNFTIIELIKYYAEENCQCGKEKVADNITGSKKKANFPLFPVQ